MKTAIIVPARLASQRFPEKLLHAVHGKPLILWTAERIREQAPEYPLWFAVDSQKLANVLEQEGFHTILTDPDLPCGTDRIAAANRSIGAQRVINVQADEPMVTGRQIRQLDQILTPGIDMATLGRPLGTPADYDNPNIVKMVRALDGLALYFSRSAIPHMRDTHGQFDANLADDHSVLVHLGLYAYTQTFLERFAQLDPSPLERLEKLEMLRALENGYRIASDITQDRLVAIDVPENVAEFEAALSAFS